MAELKFEQLGFSEEKDCIRVTFLKNYFFNLPKSELGKIAAFKTGKNSIIFENIPEKSARQKFNFLVERHFGRLTNILTKKPTVYVHKNSGIPLIGNVYFGIVYRNTNIIEVKPVTGCNLNCIYCSIDEGTDSRKNNDFLVEKDYLLQEIEKMADFIGEEWHCHIGTHGEPLLYPELAGLVNGISKIKNVRNISMDTNATFLTEEKADELIGAGLTRFNISLDSLDPKLAKTMCNAEYNIDHVKKICRYIAEKTKASLLIAPVWVRGFNDGEIEKIVRFAVEINKKDKIKLGIQNFLEYPYGRKPAGQMKWEEFYGKLKKLEEEYKTKLVLSAEDFEIHRSRVLERPFKKKELVNAKILCNGMYGNDKIAVSEERSINVMNCNAKIGETIKVRIIRDKHNCFAASCR